MEYLLETRLPSIQGVETSVDYVLKRLGLFDFYGPEYATTKFLPIFRTGVLHEPRNQLGSTR
jgi:hypothetical protein